MALWAKAGVFKESSFPSNCERKLTGCRLIKVSFLRGREGINKDSDGDTFFTRKPPQYFSKRVAFVEGEVTEKKNTEGTDKA